MTALLVRVSAAQLAAGLAGQALAIARRAHYDIPFGTGRPEHVVRDSFVMGTALSAPVDMLAMQAWATARLSRRPGRPARARGRAAGAIRDVRPTAGDLAAGLLLVLHRDGGLTP